MKYLIYKELGPVLFGDKLAHSQVAYDLNDIAYGEGNEVVSGGMAKLMQSKNKETGLMELQVVCSGEAEGIKVPRLDTDAELIEKLLQN